nr:hypothetical protein [Morchella crassipes]
MRGGVRPNHPRTPPHPYRPISTVIGLVGMGALVGKERRGCSWVALRVTHEPLNPPPPWKPSHLWWEGVREGGVQGGFGGGRWRGGRALVYATGYWTRIKLV